MTSNTTLLNIKPIIEKQGFTLLELIIVVIIIGVLATLGFTQYTKTVEYGRTAESKTVLSTARSLQIAYYMEKGAYASSYTDLGLDAPTSCTSTHYFSYDIALDAGNERARALRCSSGGKAPNASRQYWVILRFSGTHYSVWADNTSISTGFW